MNYTAELTQLIKAVKPADTEAIAKARERLDNLAKPPGSLGVLEDIAARLAGITGQVLNTINKKAVIILSADNGVVEEGVASAPQSVTYAQTLNFMRGVTGVAVLAKQANASLYVVDVGINAEISHPNIINRKVRMGTGNMRKGPAMTREEAMKAILVGAEVAEMAIADGCDLLGAGEMGIGNTSTSSALLMALTGCSADLAVGRGAGLDEAAFAHKKRVVTEAVALNNPDRSDPVDLLAKVGGLDIAAMTGVYLAAAKNRVPVVIDGFISAVAAVLAFRLAPDSLSYMFGSHLSEEPGYKLAMEQLGLAAMLNMRMRLGEGSGCPLGFSIIEFACAMMNHMATFEEASIDSEYLDQIDEISFDQTVNP
jgi:nicotinate-nucleotide--dimethylbenzimidazole phosphoribosyltransferase